MNNLINQKPFIVSNIIGRSNAQKQISFKVYAPESCTYKLYCSEASNITIFDEKENVLIKDNNFEIFLHQDNIYYVLIETILPEGDFSLCFYNINKSVVAPYKINIENDGKDIPLYSTVAKDPLQPANIEMKKRKGGTYLYCNVPESMKDEAINTILMENKDLTGDCFMTLENQNQSTHPYVYLGYRIINNNDFDLYVTISNVGYQTSGSWLGEKSWMDYYGVKYEMNAKSFNQDGLKWFKDYLNFDTLYQPQPITPTTINIPKGQYIYVIGGTIKDSYKHFNSNNTANKKIHQRECANGNVFFTINNGVANGELCAYDDIELLNKNHIVQNFRKYGENDDLGGRIGKSNHHGVIDDNPIWVINDLTENQNLPVRYISSYCEKLKDKYEPFEKVTDIVDHEILLDRWFSHLSSQYHHNYIGQDMVENETYYNNQKVTLSVNSATPAGKVWDFGNWMIEYQENCVFINQGDRQRKVAFYLKNGGSIFAIFKDEHGNILHQVASLLTCGGDQPLYVHTLPPHSRVIVSMQFVLPANNNGSIEHIVSLIK
ncbi:MAG: hypothetical protein MR270_07355 [Erysipelotrichaceae bacterium]|nr:hypothetical protein [Erysipelotrichaceae bacterium]